MNPCEYCIDPGYCNEINSCHRESLLISIGPAFNDDDSLDVNPELSDLVENEQPHTPKSKDGSATT